MAGSQFVFSHEYQFQFIVWVSCSVDMNGMSWKSLSTRRWSCCKNESSQNDGYRCALKPDHCLLPRALNAETSEFLRASLSVR